MCKFSGYNSNVFCAFVLIFSPFWLKLSLLGKDYRPPRVTRPLCQLLHIKFCPHTRGVAVSRRKQHHGASRQRLRALKVGKQTHAVAQIEVDAVVAQRLALRR